jgi:2'-5' RNA ligase
MAMSARSTRLFLGLLPPATIREEVAVRAREVLHGAVSHVYAADDVHLTLVFLGEVEGESCSRVEAGLAGAFDGAAPVRLRIGGGGAFGGAGAFSVVGHERALWAGFDLDDLSRAGLGDLVARSRRLTAAAGIELAPHDLERPFVPHLTLARPRARERVPEACAALRFDLDWTADAVHLFASVGAAAGTGRYPVRASVRLSRS